MTRNLPGQLRLHRRTARHAGPECIQFRRLCIESQCSHPLAELALRGHTIRTDGQIQHQIPQLKTRQRIIYRRNGRGRGLTLRCGRGRRPLACCGCDVCRCHCRSGCRRRPRQGFQTPAQSPRQRLIIPTTALVDSCLYVGPPDVIKVLDLCIDRHHRAQLGGGNHIPYPISQIEMIRIQRRDHPIHAGLERQRLTIHRHNQAGFVSHLHIHIGGPQRERPIKRQSCLGQ